MSKRLFLLVLAAVLSAFALACAVRAGQSSPSPSVQSPSAVPATVVRPTHTPEGETSTGANAAMRPVPTPAPARMPTPEPRVAKTVVGSGSATATEVEVPNVTVAEPRPGQLVANPLHLEGTARVFEASVEFELVADGTVLGRGFTTASIGAPERGSYAADLSYEPVDSDMDALLRVFSRSPKDGSMQDLATVPLRLQAVSAPTPETRSVHVYLVRLEGGEAVPVAVDRSVARTAAIGRSALEELLKGPTDAERANGFDSMIPAGTRLRSLTIVDGLATADFDARLQREKGGSMRVLAIRQQIERTLMQFPSVRQVEIRVEGRSEGVLEP